MKKTIHLFYQRASRKYSYFKYRFYSIMPLNEKLNAPIFIIGSGSSGTSVLSKVLETHRDVYSAKEADEVWYIASKKTNLRRYDIKGRFYFDELDFNKCQAERINRIFCHILKNAKKRRFLEKTPHNLYRVRWVKKLFPDAKFINIIRSGKDFVRSIKKRNRDEQAPGAYPGWWWRKDDYIWHAYKAMFLESHPEYSGIVKDVLNDENRAAVQWINAMESKNIESLSKENCLTLKYEDLIENPESALRRIYGFAELEYDENPVRFAKRHLKRPIYSGEPRLTPEIKKIFNEYSKLYGYDILR